LTQTILVTGTRAADREAAIAAALVPGQSTAVILEGLADGNSPLVYDESDGAAWRPDVHRIAPGCLCCAGNLVLRVTLNRLLRRPPAQLFISLADATHVDRLRAMLTAAPYDALLRLGPDLAA
jgi:hypothetical protein